MNYYKDNTQRDLNIEGTMSRRPNGSMEYKIYYYDEYGQRKRKSFCGPTDIICRERAEKFFEEIERKKKGIEVDATIPDILRAKCKSDYEKNYVQEQGYGRNLDTISMIEKGCIGDIPIAEIEVWQIDMFLRSITHYANGTIKKIYRMLKKAYEIALNKEIIGKNLMLLDELSCPRSDKPDKKVYALTVAEQKRLVDYLKDYKPPYGRNNYVSQLLISLYTGLRMGEVNALKPENIDLENRLIKVRATVTRGIDWRVIINDSTKTYAGMRDVPIPEILVPVLEKALKEQPPNEYDLIFFDRMHKKILNTSDVNDFFQRTCKKCNIEPRGQHCLRHTFATRCVEARVDYNVLKTWLGHTDIHVTMDTYTDVYANFSKNSAESYEKYLASIKASCI